MSSHRLNKLDTTAHVVPGNMNKYFSVCMYALEYTVYKALKRKCCASDDLNSKDRDEAMKNRPLPNPNNLPSCSLFLQAVFDRIVMKSYTRVIKGHGVDKISRFLPAGKVCQYSFTQ